MGTVLFSFLGAIFLMFLLLLLYDRPSADKIYFNDFRNKKYARLAEA